jgi:DNA-binding HxlR family transcriptional regulator
MDRAVKVIGKRSNMLLLREAYYGSTRYDEFVRRTGLSEPVVATELRHLVDVGLLMRVPYRREGDRERLAYRLTEMGRDAFVPMVALMEWGDKWLAPEGPPIALSHRECGADVTVELRCADAHHVSLRDVAAQPSRGARRVGRIST